MPLPFALLFLQYAIWGALMGLPRRPAKERSDVE